MNVNELKTRLRHVEVRHGKWKSRQKWNYYVCSECSFENEIAFPYCPNCGAKMDQDCEFIGSRADSENGQ